MTLASPPLSQREGAGARDKSRLAAGHVVHQVSLGTRGQGLCWGVVVGGDDGELR